MITSSSKMQNIDPYRRWLGILSPDRPLSAYQLLEVSECEDDHWLIESAADLKRDALIREKDRVPPDIFQRLLRELDEAVNLLTDPVRRPLYDQRLKEHAEAISHEEPESLEGEWIDNFASDIDAEETVDFGRGVGNGRRAIRSKDAGPVSAGAHSVAPREVDRTSVIGQTSDSFQCEDCGTQSIGGQRFCGKCGVPILQDCPRCEQQTPIREKFCINCGVEIEAEINRYVTPFLQAIDVADEAALKRDFISAIDAVTYALQTPAPGHPDIVRVRDKLQERYELYTQKLTELTELVGTLKVEAKEAIEAGNYKHALEQIGRLPESMIEGKLFEYYEQSTEAIKHKKERKQEAVAAFREKQFLEALEIIFELEDEFTSDQDMAEIRKRCEAAIQKLASKYAAKGGYEQALTATESLVRFDRIGNSDFEKIHRRVETLAMVAWDVHNSPQVDETIVALAEWLVSAVPNDKRTAESFKELKRRLAMKKKSNSPKVVPWADSNANLPTAQAKWADTLENVEIVDPDARKTINAHPGEWNVALGLALAGQGLQAVPINLIKKEPPKSTVLRLAQKIVKTRSTGFAWGIDLGNFSLRAIRIRFDRETGRVSIDRAVEAQHRSPLVTIADFERQAAIVAETLAHLSDQVQTGDHVSINCSGTGTLHRLVQFPTILLANDEKLTRLIENEVRFQMPLDIELLHWDWHAMTVVDDQPEEKKKEKQSKKKEEKLEDKSEELPEELNETSCIIAAARKNLLKRRIDWFQEAGIHVDIVQLDAIAIINALAWQRGRMKKTDEGASIVLSQKPVAMIDIGHRQSTFVVLRRDRVWIRTIPIAGNDFIHAMIGTLKLTHAKAIASLGDPPRDARFTSWSSALAEPFGQLLHEIDKSIHQYRHDMEDSELNFKIILAGRPLQIHGLWRYLRTGR